jgi:hypothetical protein
MPAASACHREAGRDAFGRLQPAHLGADLLAQSRRVGGAVYDLSRHALQIPMNERRPRTNAGSESSFARIDARTPCACSRIVIAVGVRLG